MNMSEVRSAARRVHEACDRTEQPDALDLALLLWWLDLEDRQEQIREEHGVFPSDDGRLA